MKSTLCLLCMILFVCCKNSHLDYYEQLEICMKEYHEAVYKIPTDCIINTEIPYFEGITIDGITISND